MKYETRRRDRVLNEADTADILNTGSFGVLSTVDADGMPYGVPLSYALVGNTLYFHGTRESGHKGDNIESRPQACFTVVTENTVVPHEFTTRYASAMAFGTAHMVDDEDERTVGFNALAAKYNPNHTTQSQTYIAAARDKTAIFALDITSVTGKSNR